MKVKLVFLAIVLFASSQAWAQIDYRVGVSGLMNFSMWTAAVHPNIGVEVSGEAPLGQQFGLSLTGSFHYGEHPNHLNESKTQSNQLFGLQPELRYYTQERFNGPYWGLGLDAKYLDAYNYFPDDPLGRTRFGGTDYFTTLSYGVVNTMESGRRVNMSITSGVTLTSWNEHAFYMRVGASLSLCKCNK